MRPALQLLTGLALLAGASSAMAQSSSGPYARVMFGGAYEPSSMTYTDVDPNQGISVLGPGGSLGGHLGGGMLFGAGVGYAVSPLFWTDLTASDFPNRQFHGNSTVNPATTAYNFINDSAKIDSLAVMLNGYLDAARAIGLSAGSVQPYVMGSLGYARNHMGALSGLALGGTGPITFNGASHGDLAWGLGAGIGVPVTNGIHVDIGWEYLDLGEARSGYGAFFSGANQPALPMKAEVTANTLQVALRVGF
jgi:opacity protein-like surface antigen